MKKGSKISIIGAGNVGASIAYTLTVNGMCSELVLIDIAKDKAFGEAMDIRQGTAFCPSVNIYAGEWEDAANSEIIVVTSGAARKPGQSRIDLAQGNVNIIKSFMPKLAKIAPHATYIIVSNPVDIITYTILKCTDLKENQVIGTGTSLDSGRLRSIIAEKVSLNPKNVHAYVFGEHGDSSMVPWSTTAVAGMPLDTYCKCSNLVFDDKEKDQIVEEMKKSGAKVIACKGATNYAIAQVAANVCRCVTRDNDAVLTVSTMLHGQYGIEDVCISLPCVVGASGIKRMIAPELTISEEEKVVASANVLKETISNLEI